MTGECLASPDFFQSDRAQFLILDEADRLMDMGFERDITRICRHVKESRSKSIKTRMQSVLVSATLDSKVRSLASASLTTPTIVSDELMGDAAVGEIFSPFSLHGPFSSSEYIPHSCVHSSLFLPPCTFITLMVSVFLLLSFGFIMTFESTRVIRGVWICFQSCRIIYPCLSHSTAHSLFDLVVRV